MTPSQSRPPTQPPATQIRSRITVVCAECKRLKLKCDRRTPCGSCTKRDTVVRCIYSPAAAEKVDLHSLNNRLMQVEATLSLITSGQRPPVFQSSYPFSQTPADSNFPSSNTPTSMPMQVDLQHRCHHRRSIPPISSNASIAVSLQDLSSVWLDELERDHAPALELTLDSISSSEVKVETTVDARFPQSPPTVANGSQTMASHVAHSLLPPPHIYYSSAPLERYPSQQPSSAASSSRVASQVHVLGDAVSSKPSITPALVNLLPPIARAKQLLQSAARLFYVRPVPFPACLLSSLSDESGSDSSQEHGKKGKKKAHLPSIAMRWDAFELRALYLIGRRGLTYGTSSTVKFDRKEREKIGARAREIFFGSSVSSTTPTRSWSRQESDIEAEGDAAERERPAKGWSESLPFFATVCMVLAIGAASPKVSEKGAMSAPCRTLGQEMESPEFFHALAQQTLDIWEKNVTISPSSGDDVGLSNADYAGEEEKLDYLVASLLGVGCQLYESHLETESKDEQQRKNSLNKLLPLVAKIMNMARVFGLGKPRKPSMHCKEDEPDKDKDSPRKDNQKKGKVSERRRKKDDLERLIWWDVVFYELFISDVLGHSSLLSTSCPVELPRYACALSVDENNNDQEGNEENRTITEDNEEEFNDIVEKYYGARCRLTQITQMVKHNLVHPNCCCGCTLDQAAGLEAEIRRFLEDLPPSLRFSATEDESKGDFTVHSEGGYQPGADEFEKAVLQAQKCTLAIMTQRLIIMAYLPFLRSCPTSPSPSPTSSNTSTQTGYMEEVGKKDSNAHWNPVLQPILSAAQCIIRASQQLSESKADQSSRRVLPLLLELYPVKKAVLDAVIICTYMSTSRSPLIASQRAADSAVSGMRMLWDLDLGSECNGLFRRLRKRCYVVVPNHVLTQGIKRKHEHIIVSGYETHTGLSGVSSAGQALKDKLTVHQEQWPQKRAAHDVAVGRTPSVDDNDLEAAQKDKKLAKKGHPPVGIRIRQGKMRSFLRPRMEPSPESTSNVPIDGPRESLPFITTSIHESQQLNPRTEIDPVSQRQIPRIGHNLPMASLNDPLYRSRSGSQEDLHVRLPNSQHESPQVMAFTVPLRDGDIQSRMNDSTHFGAHGHGESPRENHLNMGLRLGQFEGNGDHERQRPPLSPAYLQEVSSTTAQSSRYGSPSQPLPSGGLSYTTPGTIMLTPTPTPSFVRTPQAVVPRQVTASTHAHSYFHMGSSSSFGVNDHTHGQDVSYTGVGLDTAGGLSPSIIDGSSIDGTGMASTVPSPPVYEKPRSMTYDVKQAMDGLVQEQLHHRHHLLQHQTTYSIDQHRRDQMAVTQAWPPTPVSAEGPQRFWVPPAEGFKYFH